jgi:hypothetical protein
MRSWRPFARRVPASTCSKNASSPRAASSLSPAVPHGQSGFAASIASRPAAPSIRARADRCGPADHKVDQRTTAAVNSAAPPRRPGASDERTMMWVNGFGGAGVHGMKAVNASVSTLSQPWEYLVPISFFHPPVTT